MVGPIQMASVRSTREKSTRVLRETQRSAADSTVPSSRSRHRLGGLYATIKIRSSPYADVASAGTAAGEQVTEAVLGGVVIVVGLALALFGGVGQTQRRVVAWH